MIKPIIFIGLAATSALVAPAYAQTTARGIFDPLSYSGLRDKTLDRKATPGSIGGLIKVISPTVMRPAGFTMTAKVLEDRPGSMTFEVSYAGMPGNVRKLNVVLTDAAGTRAIVGIGTASAQLSGEAEATINFTVTLDPAALEGALQSSKIFVYGMLPSTNPNTPSFVVGASQLFDCEKKWFKQPSVLLAEPIGTIPLPPTPPPSGAPPRRKFFVHPSMYNLSQAPVISPGVLQQTVNPGAIANVGKINRIQLMRGGQPIVTRDIVKPVAMATPRQVNKLVGSLPVVRPLRQLDGDNAEVRPARMKAAFRPELIAKLKVIDPSIFALPTKQVTDNQGKGPSRANPVPLFPTNIEVGSPQLRAEEVLTIAPQLFSDLNPASGIFYYTPSQYVLDFSDTSFNMHMYYTAGAGGEAGEVHVSAFVRASVSDADLKIIDTFLKEYTAGDSKIGAPARPYKLLLPFFGNLKAALAGSFLAIGIPAEKITVDGVGISLDASTPDSIGKGEVNVHASMTVNQAAEFVTLLTKTTDIGGNLICTSTADPTLAVPVPIKLRLPDANSFRLNVTPQNVFKNDSPFPVALKFVHVLSFLEGKPTVYSFNLPDNEIAPAGSVTIDRSKIPAYLTAAPSKMWADFQVIPDAASVESAMQSVTRAAEGAASGLVTVEKVGDFPAGVTSITATVTSKYFTPFGDKELTKEVQLLADDVSKTIGPVYTNGRQEGVDMGAANPYVKWSLKVVKNGVTLRTPVQISNRLTLSIGADQIGAAR